LIEILATHSLTPYVRRHDTIDKMPRTCGLTKRRQRTKYTKARYKKPDTETPGTLKKNQVHKQAYAEKNQI
jgi:hypothetical protein